MAEDQDQEEAVLPRPPKRSKPTKSTSFISATTAPHVTFAQPKPISVQTVLPTFAQLGLAECFLPVLTGLGMVKPTPVQARCIPRIFEGKNLVVLANKRTGKTASFVLPILQSLYQYPFGVCALVLTSRRAFADDLEQDFLTLGEPINVRCLVVVGGRGGMLNQKLTLTKRPHVVIATAGRLAEFLEYNSDLPPLFSQIKFLVLDKADGFIAEYVEEDLKTIFSYLPQRQTLIFASKRTEFLENMLIELAAGNAAEEVDLLGMVSVRA